MFRDRVFNISFLISLLGHIFCIFAFVLVITPKGFTLNKFPQTQFLGAIVETSVFQPGYNLRQAGMVTPYREDFAVPGVLTLDILRFIDAQEAQFMEPGLEKQLPEMVIQEDDKD